MSQNPTLAILVTCIPPDIQRFRVAADRKVVTNFVLAAGSNEFPAGTRHPSNGARQRAKIQLIVQMCILIFYALAYTAPTYAQQQLRGTISGRVLDADGHPVSKVSVHAESADGKPRASVVVFYVQTDEAGCFSIGNLTWGSYVVSTKKESDGYPDTAFDFYNDGNLQKVSLTPQIPSAEITITLAPKADILSGTVSDAVTDAPVNGAGARLWRMNNPEFWIDTSVSSNF